ncbi:glycosyl hydrolase family 28-related protein [Paenibacillus sp. GYB004]|uniref:glycosyl hydrolase family 28-related protein n=1 Tax=Paenibacillus sp. GYB004 TaxID=2994393 RepID=UPI002F966A44
MVNHDENGGHQPEGLSDGQEVRDQQGRAEETASGLSVTRRKALASIGLTGLALAGVAACQTISPVSSLAAAGQGNGRSVSILSGTVSTVTELRDLSTAGLPDNETVLLCGYASVNDGGAGVFYWNSASTAADNGGTVIMPTGHTGSGRWIRLKDGSVSVKCFGAKGDWNGTSGTDDTAAIQAAVAAERFLYFPTGAYMVTSPISVPRDGTRFDFADPVSSKLVKRFDGYAIHLAGSYCSFTNMCIDGQGATYAGGYIELVGAAYNPSLYNPRLYDAKDAGILFHENRGSFFKAESGYISTWINNGTVLTTPSFRSAGVDTRPMHRHFSQIDTGGVVLGDLTGMETTVITGCTGRNMVFGSSTKKAIITGCRFTSAGNPFVVKGLDNSITGNVIAGDIVLDESCVNNAIGQNVTAGKLVVNGNRWRNSLHHRSWSGGFHAECTGLKQTISNWASETPITAANVSNAGLPGPSYLPFRGAYSITGLIARAVSGSITSGSVTVHLRVNNNSTGLSLTLDQAVLASGYKAQLYDAGAHVLSEGGSYTMTYSTSADYSGNLAIVAGFEIES